MSQVTEERVRELERLLAAERKTRSVLIAKIERLGAPDSAQVATFGAAARLEQLVEARTAEALQRSRELEKANGELRRLSAEMEKIVRDRTRALRASEAQLRARNVELLRLNDVKTEFIAIAAHELRTPMMSIVGYIELMLEGKFGLPSDELSARLEAVQRNAQRIVRLVNQLMDSSKLESGRATINKQPVDLVAIARSALDDLRLNASAKSHDLTEALPESLCIEGDRDKLHQVILNLLSNAVRYTPEGGNIRIEVSRASEMEYPGQWAQVCVSDSGIGIPPELRSRIFEPFTEFGAAQHHSSADPDSAGLGLYIARGFVELHGGLISVSSSKEGGSEFRVFLPT